MWDDFCSFLLEIIKPGFEKPIDKKTKSEVVSIFEKNLQLLHPFMPFLTEELWHLINDRKKDEALVISNWPKTEEYSEDLISNFENLKNIISGIRNIRKQLASNKRENRTVFIDFDKYIDHKSFEN